MCGQQCGSKCPGGFCSVGDEAASSIERPSGQQYEMAQASQSAGQFQPVVPGGQPIYVTNKPGGGQVYGGQPVVVLQQTPGGQPTVVGQPTYAAQPGVVGQPPYGGQPVAIAQQPYGGQPVAYGQQPYGGQPITTVAVNSAEGGALYKG